MAIGLKNAEELLPRVSQFVHFAVNEECASMANSDGCDPYAPFLKMGKPVFHIEYVKYSVKGNNVTIRSETSALRSYSSEKLESLYCLQTALRNKKRIAANVAPLFSTVIKAVSLEGFVMYCDGSWGITKTTEIGAENVNVPKQNPGPPNLLGKGTPKFGKGTRGNKESKDLESKDTPKGLGQPSSVRSVMMSPEI